MICDTLSGERKAAAEAREKDKADGEAKHVEPGDIRANKGLIFLKDEYIPIFPQPYF